MLKVSRPKEASLSVVPSQINGNNVNNVNPKARTNFWNRRMECLKIDK